MSRPVLPPELERKIFEMAFDPLERLNSSRMMLVARRSRIWIRPLIYAIFDQRQYLRYGHGPFPNFKKLPPSVDMKEICQYAKHLVLDESVYIPTEVKILIHQCPNLINLALWGWLDIIGIQDSVATLDNLQRLSVTIEFIDHKILHIQTLFRNLTHLELIYPPDDFGLHELVSLPNLTHLSLYLHPVTIGAQLQRHKWEALISSCSHIQVFLFYISTENLSPGLKKLFEYDSRVVFVDYSMNDAEDWHRGAQGMPDIWDHSSRVVFARRNGYLKPNNHTAESLSRNIPWLDYLTEGGKEWF